VVEILFRVSSDAGGARPIKKSRPPGRFFRAPLHPGRELGRFWKTNPFLLIEGIPRHLIGIISGPDGPRRGQTLICGGISRNSGQILWCGTESHVTCVQLRKNAQQFTLGRIAHGLHRHCKGLDGGLTAAWTDWLHPAQGIVGGASGRRKCSLHFPSVPTNIVALVKDLGGHTACGAGSRSA